MKKAVIINSLKQAQDIVDLVDAYMVPIQKFSMNYDHVFSLSAIKEIKALNKEVFVIINKNIHNDELAELQNLLNDLDKIAITGLVFYDVALVNLKTKLKLKTDLVWAQEHMTTNYATINYWYDKGVKYAYLSSELTKAEIEQIKAQTNMKLFVNGFGYVPMFSSQRRLVNNYIEHFNLENHQGPKQIYKEGNYYPIIDKENGTTVYSNYVLNAIAKLDVDYLVYNSYLINDEDFKIILKYNKSDKYPEEYGFLYKETIYKVKNNE